jgi:hypothetical protein
MTESMQGRLRSSFTPYIVDKRVLSTSIARGAAKKRMRLSAITDDH